MENHYNDYTKSRTIIRNKFNESQAKILENYVENLYTCEILMLFDSVTRGLVPKLNFWSKIDNFLFLIPLDFSKILELINYFHIRGF